MGNSNSSQSLRSGRSSRLRRSEDGEGKNRLSHAISFYQTPPGSLDLRELEQGGSTPRSPSSSNRTSKIASPVSPEKQDPVDDVPPQKEWKAGVYSLINSGSGTVADLSAGDQKSIIGFPAHHGPNQQWLFTPLGEGYTIRSVLSGLYLTVEAGVCEGAPLVASPFPVTWKVKAANEGGELFLRIFWPNEAFAFQLADATAGTKVQLSRYKADEACQLWRVLEHDVPPHLRDSASASSASDDGKPDMTVTSPPTATLVISEDKDAITTTRTTTTVTTVTTVTKTPRAFMM